MSEASTSQPFVNYLASRLPLVEEALVAARALPLSDSTITEDLDTYLYQPLIRFTASGGKRVRPVLCLLGAEAVGGQAEDALSCAVAVELFQSAALIHDDIADKSELRRGEPCLYRTEGTGLAINDGDLALVRTFEVVLADERLPEARRTQLLRALATMQRHTLEGQALDLGWVRDSRWEVSAEDYLVMVESKTAWYSAAIPLYLGAIASGGDTYTAERLREVGLHAGIAFQVKDDLLNLVGDATSQGKDLRSDITEGKRTLAALWALAHLDENDRATLKGLLESGTTDEGDLARAVCLIERGGGIEACRTLAAQEADHAKAIVYALETEGRICATMRELVVSMTDFFVRRTG